jgi:ABC-type transport system involved in multi-copper enzyme maturation permease subunit
MDPFYLIAIVIVSLIYFGLPGTLIFITFRILKKRTSIRIALTTTGILLFGFIFLVIRDFNPTTEYYKSDFEHNTELPIPNSAELTQKRGNNTLYNFGDYNISYVFRMNSSDYSETLNKLMARGFEQKKVFLETSENDELFRQLPNITVTQIITKDYGFRNYEVLFMNDKQTIICNSNKW